MWEWGIFSPCENEKYPPLWENVEYSPCVRMRNIYTVIEWGISTSVIEWGIFTPMWEWGIFTPVWEWGIFTPVWECTWRQQLIRVAAGSTVWAPWQHLINSRNKPNPANSLAAAAAVTPPCEWEPLWSAVKINFQKSESGWIQWSWSGLCAPVTSCTQHHITILTAPDNNMDTNSMKMNKYVY